MGSAIYLIPFLQVNEDIAVVVECNMGSVNSLSKNIIRKISAYVLKYKAFSINAKLNPIAIPVLISFPKYVNKNLVLSSIMGAIRITIIRRENQESERNSSTKLIRKAGIPKLNFHHLILKNHPYNTMDIADIANISISSISIIDYRPKVIKNFIFKI